MSISCAPVELGLRFLVQNAFGSHCEGKRESTNRIGGEGALCY